MTEPILDPEYWAERVRKSEQSGQHEHHAVFRCSVEKWSAIGVAHRELLKVILPTESILDCGCGYGRLLDLLPDTWKGHYMGVDLSSAMISKAQRLHPDHMFRVMRFDEVGDSFAPKSFDWAVLISIRPMITRNLSPIDWNHTERSIRRVAKRLLFLEYDPNDGGSIE